MLNQIIHGDCLEVMRGMPAGSVDLVVTSPPYNLGRPRGNTKGTLWSGKLMHEGYDDDNDTMPDSEYVAWQRDCLAEMMRLLSDGGAIFYNHKWRSQNNILNDRSDIVDGFPVRQIIIWHKGHGFNFNCGHFVSCFEVIYVIGKPGFRVPSDKAKVGDVWRFNHALNNPHPAPFPIALPQRCIDATDAKVVLDPFMGSGTTAIAAIRAGRNWIGIEQSEKYCEMAEERIALELRKPALFSMEGTSE